MKKSGSAAFASMQNFVGSATTSDDSGSPTLDTEAMFDQFGKGVANTGGGFLKRMIIPVICYLFGIGSFILMVVGLIAKFTA